MKALQSFREKLPAFKVRSEFLKAVAENQVEFYKLLVLFNVIVCTLSLRVLKLKFAKLLSSQTSAFVISDLRATLLLRLLLDLCG